MIILLFRSLNDFALKLHRYNIPKPYSSLEVNIGMRGRRKAITLYRNHFADQSSETANILLLWALPILLKNVPLDQIILIIGCALAEMTIFVCSPDTSVVSGCLVALLNLLRPLKWSGSFVVPCPTNMPELLDNPVFKMLGLCKLPDGFVIERHMLIVDPKEKIVHMHPSDIVESHTFVLPQASKLSNSLKPYVDTIIALSKSQRPLGSAGKGPNPTEGRSRASSLSSSTSYSTKAGGTQHPAQNGGAQHITSPSTKDDIEDDFDQYIGASPVKDSEYESFLPPPPIEFDVTKNNKYQLGKYA
jgi:hypothetical protein